MADNRRTSRTVRATSQQPAISRRSRRCVIRQPSCRRGGVPQKVEALHLGRKRELLSQAGQPSRAKGELTSQIEAACEREDRR